VTILRKLKGVGAAIVLGVFLTNPAIASKRTEVLVVASLHGLHKKDANYPYDRLYALVSDFKPDVVGIELRPEDIKADADYLSKSYPHEMIALRDQYSNSAVGFDWLGDEIAGGPIPDDWWTKRSKVKAIERAMNADPKMSDAESARISDAQTQLLKDATPSSLTDGRYYKLVRQERAWLARHTAHTPYKDWVRFNDARESHIDANLAKIVRSNSGRRIVFVMGADHYGFAVDSLRAGFGGKIDLQLPQ